MNRNIARYTYLLMYIVIVGVALFASKDAFSQEKYFIIEESKQGATYEYNLPHANYSAVRNQARAHCKTISNNHYPLLSGINVVYPQAVVIGSKGRDGVYRQSGKAIATFACVTDNTPRVFIRGPNEVNCD